MHTYKSHYSYILQKADMIAGGLCGDTEGLTCSETSRLISGVFNTRPAAVRPVVAQPA